MANTFILFAQICKAVLLANPINGFRHAVTYPSRQLCFLHAYASWLHQSMTGLSQFGLSNENKYPSRQRGLHSNDMAEPDQLLDVNTVHNIHVIGELIQVTVRSVAEIITIDRRSYVGLFSR